MSAIAPTAAEKRTSFHVGFVPTADIAACSITLLAALRKFRESSRPGARDSSRPTVAGSARGVARAASQIDLQLLELGDVLIDALLPFLAQRLPDLRRYRMDIRQDGQLLGDFLKVEARALRKRDVDDPVKGRFAVAALAPARLAFGRDQAELLIVTQRRCRHGGALGHLADVDQLTGCHHWAVALHDLPNRSRANHGVS